MLKYFFHFICCVLFSSLVISCHLDKKKTTPKTPPPPKSPPTKPPAPKPLIWSGAIQVTSGKKYQHLLGSHRKCIHSSFCTFYEGPGKCKNFSKGDISVQFVSSGLPSKVTVRIQPFYTGTQSLPLQFWFGICNFNVDHRSPIVLEGTARYINDYKGFHVRLTGLSGISGGLIVKSDDSLPEVNSTLNVDIYYGGLASTSTKLGTAELANPDSASLHPDETGGR